MNNTRFLRIMIAVLFIATVVSAPTEIYRWTRDYPWWWTLNAVGVYGISLVGIYGVYRYKKWGFWLSVGSTAAAPLYLRPNDETLMSLSGALGYIGLFGILIGLYWWAILRNWNKFH